MYVSIFSILWITIISALNLIGLLHDSIIDMCEEIWTDSTTFKTA